MAVLLAFVINGFSQEIHFDFSILNSTGYEFYYRIIDPQNHWVEVTYPCQNGDNYWWGYDKPEGKLILADTVTYQGTDYFLVAIGDHAFCGCSGLRGTLEFPESIRSIGAGAFKDCSNLNGNLSIPTLVTRIEDETFSGCSRLSGKLHLNDSLTFIGDQAFYNCSQFSGQLIVPSKVATIGNHAFENCGFKGMMMLPAALQSIGEAAFKGMTTINCISIKAVTPPTTGSNAFAEVPTWISVAVPYTQKEAYQNAPEWSRFANRIVEKSYWNGNAEPWTKGCGTNDNPYLIESAENLAWLAKSVNKAKIVITPTTSPGGVPYDIYHFYDVDAYQDTCFRLVIDIDLRKGEDMLWYPIGNKYCINEDDYPGSIIAPHYSSNGHYHYYNTFFLGQFDGNGHTISRVQYRSSYHVGLFGIIRDATVQNLTINDLLINQYDCICCGGVIGTANNSTIYNCHTSGTFSSFSDNGGIVGTAQKCHIEECTAKITFNSSRVGGIVGYWVCDTISTFQEGIFNCGFVGNTNDSYKVGGIVGSCNSITEGRGNLRIEHCFSRGNITRIIPNPNYTVETGDKKFGGIVGDVANIDTLCILNCYSNDTITGIGANLGNARYFAGGILGYADVNTTLCIKNSYHVGPITATYKGGILAQNTNMTIVRNCFFDETVVPDDGFGLPLESDYMKTEAFVSQLNNGSSVFRMDTNPFENGGYPIFGTDGLIFVGAEWYYEIYGEDGTITYQHLQCVGDTTINNERPKVIVRSNTQYDREGHTEVTHEYVYEENGIVYWWNKNLQAFTMLYDFGAEVGDDWEIKVGSRSIITHVYEIEMQMIDGIPYKRMTIGDANNLFSGTLISTIGHLTSFFPEKLMNQGKDYRVEGLRCYWLDGDLMLKLGDKDCDEVYQQYHNGIDESVENSFAVYPNPAKGILYVETRHGMSLPAEQEYRITNLTGQTLLKGNITAETQQIDISGLPTGMYFISVSEQTEKFVKR